MSVQPSAEALNWAEALAASIADAEERAMVRAVIDSVTEGRKLPSWRVMSPLMRAAALALQGKTRPWEEVDIAANIASGGNVPNTAPDTIIQPDPETGELRELARKQVAEAIDAYARTFPEGSLDRGIYHAKMLEVLRGGPEWQWLRENSEALRPLLGRTRPWERASSDD